jgi:hypothetical protein
MREGIDENERDPLSFFAEMRMFLTTKDPRVRRLIADAPALMEMNRKRTRNQMNPYHPFADVIADGAWSGERAFIIGGGPSLIGFDFERLRGRGRIIAINKSFLDVPFADVLYFMDFDPFYVPIKKGKWGADVLAKWNAFKGHRVFLNIMGRELEDVYSVRSLGMNGISTSLRMGIYHGNNSGVGALALAICLRANPIYLLGIDCKFAIVDGKKISHYHDGYSQALSENSFRGFMRNFDRLNRYLSRTSFRVINLNPDSGLRCFPFSTIDEVLNDGETGKNMGNDGRDLQQRDGICQCP